MAGKRGSDMPAPMHPLVDFLNHGILPFTGRGAEAEKIMRFWQGAGDSHGLQAMLLVGEAGLGKSRIVEEIASGIKRANGAVVHTKLYPESATSIAPLVARAIWRFSAAHPLLKIEPEENIGSAVGALRRLVRLRQTLLIFEDMHLLNGEGIADFAALLDALADEHVAVLCLARPAELTVRPLLERHLVDEVELTGLGNAEIEELWCALFGDRPGEDLTALLVRATTGNPLALRSALRGALKSGAIARDGSSAWRITLSPSAFEDALARSVRLLTEGMAAHLTESERQAAEQIACLGEVVSREAAIGMIGDEHLLDLLAFKGILVETGTLMPPLSGAGSSHALLAFTHTLLHRRLAENAAAKGSTIARVIAGDLSLYSTVPFGLLADHADGLDPAVDDIACLIDRTLKVVDNLDSGPDWRLSFDVWNVADALFKLYGEALPGDERFVIQARLYALYLRLLRGRDATEEYGRIAGLFMRLTDRELTDELMEYRLQALRSIYWYNSRHDYGATHAIRERVDELIAAHPRLRTTRSYVDYLSRVANASGLVDMATLRLVESELETLRASPDVDDELRGYARRTVAPHFLMMFDGMAELEARLRLLTELETDPHGVDGGLRLTKITMFINICYLHEARALLDDAITWFGNRGRTRSAHYCELMRQYCIAALDDDYSMVETEAEKICAEAEAIAPYIRQHASTYFAFTGLLRGDSAWGHRVATNILKGSGAIDAALELGLAVSMDDADAIARCCTCDEAPFPILRAYICGDEELAPAIESLRMALRDQLVRASDYLTVRMVIDLVEYIARTGRKELAAALEDDIREAMNRSFAWLDAHGLTIYMNDLLARHGGYLARAERASWAARLAALAHAADGASTKNDSAIALSMLGSIEATRSGEEPARPRGVRLRTLLGLMVADRMLESPLSQREFCRLAASDAAEFEDARKTVNLAVHRLREMLGHDAILTDQETPRLNLDLARVDLLAAHELLAETMRHIRDGSLPRAFSPLMEVLEITRGEVPFPTLYDDFFEAARDDFENRLRSAVMRVAKGLLNDGDAAGAEQILRRAFTAMPDDEELAAMLSEALIRLGKRTEAKRIRLQADGMAA